jgi:hypothetical protein
MDQNERWQAKVIHAILTNIGPENRFGDAKDLVLSAQDQFDKEDAERFRNSLFNSLKFPDMKRRSQAVSNPHPKTFEWIFSPDSEQDSPNFTRFLEGDQNLFWITGKPAAGKSTLMKFISEDPRTTRHLEVWASGKDLFVSSFYFWFSGTAMQMSQQGLFRTLLYEALQELPYLVPLVFPDRMETFIVFGNGVFWAAPWGMSELLEAFKRLVLEITKSKRMFLLIDGLDEYNGMYSEQLELVTFICSLFGLKRQDMCVQSSVECLCRHVQRPPKPET